MARIDDLLAAMTLTEKLGQLTMTACSSAVTGPVIAGDSTEALKSGAIGNLLNLVGLNNVRELQRLAVEESRLKIPLLIALDVVHGYRTLFPIPLGEAAAFDPELWQSTAREAARESSADGQAMTFAPMLDVARDPRWGRSAEGPGEDPYLASAIGAAKVRGFQSADLSRPDAVAAVAKHYLAYGGVTAGREYASVDISERTLREVYLPPFTAAVQAGVAAIMPAFTDLAGVPMTANVALLCDLLRGELKFEGVLVSDYNAIAELIHHGIAKDRIEAAALALKAGVDIDMMSDAYRHGLPVALERGLVGIRDIDASVRRVLRLKERLGLFDDPYRHGSVGDGAEAIAARRRLSRRAAAQSIVLLKNEATLPLANELARIALIGPLALASAEMRGPWWGAADPAGHISVFEGLREQWPKAEVLCEAGVGIMGEDTSGFEPALAAVEAAEVVVLCVGEAATMSGEASSRAHIDLPGLQRALVEAVCRRAQARGKRVVALVFSGRPLAISWLAEQADALLACWFPGSESGHAVADILAGRVSPSGRTPVSWPRALGQVPIYFAQRASGRPLAAGDRYTSKYLDVPNEPLYPFGFGLTYGAFKLSNLSVSPHEVRHSSTLEVRVEVANVGRREATETVFVFTHRPHASVAPPLLELRGFTRITLAPGAHGSARVSIPAASLAVLGVDLKQRFESGELEVLVGPSADRAQLLAASVRLG